MTFDYVSISAQDFFFRIRNICGNVQKIQTWKMVPMPSVTYELTTVACFLSSKPQRHAIFFVVVVSFSKDVFLVLVKSETNRVTGKPNMGRTRVENRKERKPWRAN